eukprot:Amastigsp_a841034_169.p2 type:complete len:115 gc:universal Amastigsp_a841034_169:1134-790(-)
MGWWCSARFRGRRASGWLSTRVGGMRSDRLLRPVHKSSTRFCARRSRDQTSLGRCFFRVLRATIPARRLRSGARFRRSRSRSALAQLLGRVCESSSLATQRRSRVSFKTPSGGI